MQGAKLPRWKHGSWACNSTWEFEWQLMVGTRKIELTSFFGCICMYVTLLATILSLLFLCDTARVSDSTSLLSFPCNNYYITNVSVCNHYLPFIIVALKLHVSCILFYFFQIRPWHNNLYSWDWFLFSDYGMNYELHSIQNELQI